MSERDLDPRTAPSDDASGVDSAGMLRPEVAGTFTGASVWLVSGGALLAGLLVFFWLSSHRPGPPREVTRSTLPDAGATAAAAPLVPPEIDSAEQAARNPAPAAAPPPVPVAAVVTPPPPLIVTPVVHAPTDPPAATVEGQRRRAPSLVVDFGGDTPGVKPNGTAASDAARPGGGPNADESFAARLDSAQPERSRAVMLRNRATTVSQGAMIPAVLETALNSDLPGFTRAVVSRDVRSFDGSTVLIPRGSRVIGQYRSGLALGASRAFVIWTRVLRPDGASIQIGSNGADELGRAGFAGKVDRHFFERFSGAALLSAITLGQAALTNGNSTQVTIGSSSDASSLAGAATSLAPQQISPTIKVPQGTPIRIFVARDLDFTPVEGADAAVAP